MFNRFIKRHTPIPGEQTPFLPPGALLPQHPAQTTLLRPNPCPPYNTPAPTHHTHNTTHITHILMQIDGTPGNNINNRPGKPNQAGIAVVIRDQHGRILHWLGTRAPAQTNNEAEYQALILGLRLLISKYKHTHVTCLTDSQLVIDLSTGRCTARSPSIIALHNQANKLQAQIQNLTFVHIPRETNRLADALAWEALFGTNYLLRHLKTDNTTPNANQPNQTHITLNKEQTHA